MSDISSSSDTSTASAINTNGSSPSAKAPNKNSLRLNFEPTNFPSIADGDGSTSASASAAAMAGAGEGGGSGGGGAQSSAVPVVEKPVKSSSVSESRIPPSASANRIAPPSSSSTMRPNLILTDGAIRLPTSASTSQIDKFRVDSGLQGSSGKLKISPELTFDFTAEDLEDLGEIGRGAYGTVQKMLHIKSNTLIAVKRIRCTVDEREQKKLMMDLEVVMKSNACPFIVQFFGAIFKEGDCWICMELMDASLDKFYKYVYRKMNQRMPENIIGKIALATVQALSYLKDQLKIIHRDVKPSNILLDREGNIKLCDFGISGQLVDSIAQSRDAGCRPYMAPERIDPNTSKGYDIRSDVWSLGITLYEISTGKFPYPKWNSIFEQLCQVVQGDPPQLSPSMSGCTFSNEFIAFVNTCLIKDHLQRPKYTRLLQHPFLIRSANEVVDVKGYFSYVFDTMGPSVLQQRLEDLLLIEDDY